MKKISILAMACLGLVTTMVGCAPTHPVTPGEEFQGQTAEQIFSSGEKALAKGSYKDAISHFEGLDAMYPFSEYEQQGSLDKIYAYYASDDFPSSAAAADRYIHLYPRSANVDYAYYMRGMANFNQDRGVIQRYIPTDISQRDIGTAKVAFINFAELLRRYPHSVYAPDARNRMIYLRNLIAQKEVNIAEYYFKRKEYVAAINRANGVIIHYQQSPQVVDALGVMVKAYRQLGLTQLADDSLAVLELNFPDSTTYKEVSAVR